MLDNSMKSEDVVAAIIKKGNLYLVTQRNKDKYMGLKWEFPGGKVEANETLQEALIREIHEELNININVYGGGATGQAEAVRLALSRAMCELNEENREILKPEGLLTRDPRMVERKKFGQKKARKKFQFSKR